MFKKGDRVRVLPGFEWSHGFAPGQVVTVVEDPTVDRWGEGRFMARGEFIEELGVTDQLLRASQVEPVPIPATQ